MRDLPYPDRSGRSRDRRDRRFSLLSIDDAQAPFAKLWKVSGGFRSSERGASALIEVKWLGRSTATPRKPAPHITYTDYGPSRAQEGANQLADYLDREIRHTGSTATRGYLVIFDARRKNIQGATDALSPASAMHFAGDVLKFDPDHAKSRDDFAEPVRFFLNPRKSNFVNL